MVFQVKTKSRASTERRRLKFKIFCWTAFGIAAWLCAFSYFSPQLAGKSWLGRKLLSSSECREFPSWIRNGGVALHFVGVLYLFLGIAIICDDFFVGSLEAISERLGLSEDVAGATFMAAGSSAPELFSSLVALTNDGASNDIGIGTIVGSAIFNILIIIGVTAIFSGRTLYLDYRPLMRDAFFYALAIGGIIGIFIDGKIFWWEGLASVVFYGIYIIFMKYNTKLMKYFPAPERKASKVATESPQQQTNAMKVPVSKEPLTTIEGAIEDPELGEETIATGTKKEDRTVAIETSAGSSNIAIGANYKPEVSTEEEEESNPFALPKKCSDIPIWLLSLPWYLFFTITVPNCQKERWQNWYIVTFVNSILWIGVISWFMVEWAADIGCVLGIPSAVMGVTVLAAGTSIPDALSSVVVAKQGMGDMAVANAVGSNVFDIWLGLGLPWLLVIPFKSDGGSGWMTYIEVDNGELLPNVLILFGVLIFYLGSVIFAKWKLFPTEGYLFVALYAIYATYCIVAVWLFDVYNAEDD